MNLRQQVGLTDPPNLLSFGCGSRSTPRARFAAPHRIGTHYATSRINPGNTGLIGGVRVHVPVPDSSGALGEPPELLSQ